MTRREAVERRFASVDSSWRRHFKAGTYIPAVAGPQLASVKKSESAAVLREIERLADLGSPWASTLLGFQALMLQADGTRRIDPAIALCEEAASRGDAYAQYIMYWAKMLKGQHTAAIAYLQLACKQLFPPAMVDSISFYWAVRRNIDPKGVQVSVRQAKDTGHYGASLRESRIYISGRLGILRWILGCVSFPFALCKHLYACWRHPFSARTFAFGESLKLDDQFSPSMISRRHVDEAAK